MKYNVEYSPSARKDLDRVWYEVFEASKDYDICEKYLNDLLDKIEAKAIYPKSATPLYYEDLFTGYYYISFKAYLAFYRIEGDKLLVERVLFAASDYRRYLHLSIEQ
jgi:hypothetical protein